MSIKVQNLTLGYQEKILAKELNLSLMAGELVSLIGPNGVGKSTLFKTMLGLQSKIAGEILINDHRLESFDRFELARTVSMLLTDKIDIDYIKVPELVELGSFPHQDLTTVKGRKDFYHRLLDMKDFFGLGYIWHEYYNELSDGQKQRVLLARAAMQSMENLILDEPTTYLDIKGKRELFKLLKRISLEKKGAVLLSTHDLDLAFEYSSKIWVMSCDGRIIEGSPNEIKSSGLINEVFGL
ncbi:MAG: ABC transporter ATP-binding protein [Bacteriovoracaceae bacterium]|jgi:iron complex transport system ATP-binding protein|nr:ABC transporter ATP-binding protein [Bacteriovoracaceae bacterium]